MFGISLETVAWIYAGALVPFVVFVACNYRREELYPLQPGKVWAIGLLWLVSPLTLVVLSLGVLMYGGGLVIAFLARFLQRSVEYGKTIASSSVFTKAAADEEEDSCSE